MFLNASNSVNIALVYEEKSSVIRRTRRSLNVCVNEYGMMIQSVILQFRRRKISGKWF